MTYELAWTAHEKELIDNGFSIIMPTLSTNVVLLSTALVKTGGKELRDLFFDQVASTWIVDGELDWHLIEAAYERLPDHVKRTWPPSDVVAKLDALELMVNLGMEPKLDYPENYKGWRHGGAYDSGKHFEGDDAE